MQYVDEKALSSFQKVDTNTWEEMKDNVFIRMINQKYVKKYDENIVHQKFLDLAMCCHVQEKKGDVFRSHILTTQDMDKYGVDIDTMFSVARKNTENARSKRIFTPAEHLAMTNPGFPLVGKIQGKIGLMAENSNQPLGIIGGMEDEDTVLMLCDKRMGYGSSYMTSHKVLEEIFERFNRTNYYIVPISVFAVMCVKSSFVNHGGAKSLQETEDDLMDMLETMNDTVDNWKNILSYKIYYYYGDDTKTLFLIK